MRPPARAERLGAARKAQVCAWTRERDWRLLRAGLRTSECGVHCCRTHARGTGAHRGAPRSLPSRVREGMPRDGDALVLALCAAAGAVGVGVRRVFAHAKEQEGWRAPATRAGSGHSKGTATADSPRSPTDLPGRVGGGVEYSAHDHRTVARSSNGGDRKPTRRTSLVDQLPRLEKHLDALACVTASQQGAAAKLRALFICLRSAAAELAGADRASLFIVDEDADTLWTVLDNGEDVEIPIETGLAGACARAAKVVSVMDAYGDERFDRGFDKRFGYRTKSVLCLPVVVEKRTIGVLQVVNKVLVPGAYKEPSEVHEPTPFTDEDGEVLAGFLRITAVSILTAKGMRADQTAKRRSETLHGLAESLLSTVDAQRLFALLTRTALSLFGCEAALVLLADHGKQELYSLRGAPGGHDVRVPLSTPCVATMVWARAEKALSKAHAHGLGAVGGVDGLSTMCVCNSPPELAELEGVSGVSMLDALLLGCAPKAMVCMAITLPPKNTATGTVSGRVLGVVQVFNKRRTSGSEARLPLDGEGPKDDSEANGHTHHAATDGAAARATGWDGHRRHISERFNDEDIETLRAYCSLAAHGVQNSNVYSDLSTTRTLDIMGNDDKTGSHSPQKSPRKVAAPVRLRVLDRAPVGPEGADGASSGDESRQVSAPKASSSSFSNWSFSYGSRRRSMLPTDDGNDASMRRLAINTRAVGGRTDLLSWDCDILGMAKEELPELVLAMFNTFELCAEFDIERETLARFLGRVLDNYRDNPYHNAYHAVQVVHSVFLILLHCERVKTSLSSLDVLALLIAAVCHDVDHRGTNNAYHMSLCDELALQYNDTSVNEQHHCRLTFAILEVPGCEVLQNLSVTERRTVRARSSPLPVPHAATGGRHLQLQQKLRKCCCCEMTPHRTPFGLRAS